MKSLDLYRLINIRPMRYLRSILFYLSLWLFAPMLLAATALDSSNAKTDPSTSPPSIPLAELTSAIQNQGPDYTPRTEHLNKEGQPLFTNRLILEPSPYLLQHAHNPVNWYSWSEEALSEAKRSNKPIFLSIGYSTCHWCHVMEKESFENIEIANYLNKHFISIKVDREQRPDIDNTYMIASALLSGQTGWPLNVLNTPEAAPFYAATYFPPEQFLALLKRTQQLWQQEQLALVKESDRIIAAITEIQANNSSPSKITHDTYAAALEQWLDIFDEFEGGFGTAPKFPQEPTLLFMLDQADRTQDKRLLKTVTKTLNAMQQGGIYDQVAGGFHRYATDPSWQIPHFEKMLYNQAQLSTLYLQAYALTGDPLYRQIVVETLDYVLREMRNQQHLFYSATDADSEGEEGTFFIWSDDELRNTLSVKHYKTATTFFGISEGSNFSGRNILYQPLSIPEYVIEHQLNPVTFLAELTEIKRTLLIQRQKRAKPHLDDKIITAWNSMLIRALAQAGADLKIKRYTNAATTAADALWNSHYSSTGLIRDSRHSRQGSKGNLEDYSTFALANLTLYSLTDHPKWLNRATTLGEELISKFWDEANSTLFLTEPDQTVLVRSRSQADQAIPAAESFAYELLNRLAVSQENQLFPVIASQLLTAKSGKISTNPMNYSYLLMAHAKHKASLERIQFGALGALKAELKLEKDYFELVVKLKPGWHINAQKPGDKRLIGSSIEADWLDSISYPKAHATKVNFTKTTINLYSDRFRFKIRKNNNENTLQNTLRFTYQACSTEQCLAPETLYFSPNIQ